MPIRYCFFVAFLLFCCSSVFAQKTRQELDAEKASTLQKIAETKKTLQETSAQKRLSLNHLKVLNTQILEQEKEIELMREEANLIDREVLDIRKNSALATQQLESLRSEYAKMLYEASKNQRKLDDLVFLFSANDFSQLMIRYNYLNQYGENRAKQVEKIKQLQVDLAQREQKLQAKKQEQAKLLKDEVAKTQDLESTKAEKMQVVAQLSQKEKELRAEIAEAQQAIAKVQNTIARLVEVRRVRKERKRRQRKPLEGAVKTPEPIKESPSAPLDEEEKVDEAYTSSFSSLRNRLIWPVKGFISDRFGQKSHPTLSGIMIDNLGVDIRTSEGENVRAVCAGIVRDISTMPNFYTVVAIEHGNYMTVYAKLGSVSVQVGDKVNAKQSIGTVKQDNDGSSELNFQIWQGNNRQNPEKWLGRK